MSNTIRKFDFEFINGPTVEVCIFLLTYLKSRSGLISVTAGLTELEVDTNIQLLKDDLDRVGKEAKIAIIRRKAKTLTENVFCG